MSAKTKILPLAVLLGLTWLFFWPLIFTGAVYIAPDSQAPTSATAPLHAALREGTYPLWNPYLFSGMPSFASLMWTPYVIPASLIGELLNWLFSSSHPFGPPIHAFLAGLGMFFYLRAHRIGRPAAVFGALAFEFTPHLVGMVAFGHNSKLYTIAYLPWALWAVERLLIRPTVARTATLGLVLGLQLLSAHVQMAYYTWLAVGLYALVWGLRQIRIRSQSAIRNPQSAIVRAILSLLASLILAVGLSAVLILPVQNYARYSVRGSGLPLVQAGQWSLPPWETLTLLLPGLFGFGGSTYWGGMTFSDFPHYVGGSVLALAALAMSRIVRGPWSVVRGKNSGNNEQRTTDNGRWLLLLTGLSFLLTWGSYLGPLFTGLRAVLPFYDRFRAPVQGIILAQFALAALAGIGLQHALDHSSRRFPRYLLWTASTIAALALLAMLLHVPLMKSLDATWSSAPPEVNAARFALIVRSLWQAAFVLGAAGWLLHAFAAKHVGRAAFLTLLMALSLVDLWMVDRALNAPQPNTLQERSPAEEELAQMIHKTQEPGRLLPLGPLFTDNRWAAYNVFSAGGYHAAKLSVYQTFLDAFDLPERPHPLAMALLNVRWVLSHEPLHAPSLELVSEDVLPYGGGFLKVYLYQNTGALPRAWLVDSYQIARDLTVALNILRADGFNPAETVVLLEKPPLEPSPGAQGSVEIAAYGLHEIVLHTQADTPRLLVLSEVFYPNGWRATVDGEPTPVLQANHLLRSVAVPAGDHQVAFRFEPVDVRLGLGISLMAGMLIVVGLAWRRGEREKERMGEWENGREQTHAAPPLPHSPCEVDVVICTYGRRSELLKECLRSLNRSTLRPCAVVVVDNASQDPIAEVLRAEFPDVQVIRHATNLGFAPAMDWAVRNCGTSPYVFLLNDDTCVAPECLERLMARLNHDASIAAVQPKIHSLEDPAFFDYAGACGGFMDRFGYPFLRGRLVSRIERDEGQYDDPRPVFWVSGAALLIRRQAFLEAGGFDNDFINHMEEIDLSWRLHLHGYSVWVEPAALVEHVAGYAPGRMSYALSFLKHRNSLNMMLKNYALSSLLRYLPLRLVLEAGSILFSVVRGDLAYAWVIIKALVAVLLNLPGTWRKRRTIQSTRTVDEQPVLALLYPGSLLISWYLFRKRTFQALRWKIDCKLSKEEGISSSIRNPHSAIRIPLSLRGPYHIFLERMVARQVRQRVTDGVVLDAGCGAGGLSRRLSHLGYQVMAVDGSSAACTLASKGGVEGRWPQVAQGDLTRLMLASNAVDVACYKEVLEHIDDDEAVVRECYRVLRPGGLCVVTVPAHPHLWSQLDEMAGHYRRYTRRGLVDLFRQSGFIVEQCLRLGFPVGRLWNRVVLPPLVRRYSSSAQGILFRVLETVLAWESIWQTLSLVFYIDWMFTFTDWGNDLLLIARKPSSREILNSNIEIRNKFK